MDAAERESLAIERNCLDYMNGLARSEGPPAGSRALSAIAIKQNPLRADALSRWGDRAADDDDTPRPRRANARGFRTRRLDHLAPQPGGPGRARGQLSTALGTGGNREPGRAQLWTPLPDPQGRGRAGARSDVPSQAPAPRVSTRDRPAGPHAGARSPLRSAGRVSTTGRVHGARRRGAVAPRARAAQAAP